jgi:hypothetical protein
MPFLGVANHLGDSGTFYNTGATFGTLLGMRLQPAREGGVRLSINGELRFDVLNFANVPPGESWSGSQFEIGPSPMLHAPFQMGEFVAGFKVAMFGYQATYTFPDVNGFDTTTRENWLGWSLGPNTGAFFTVSRAMYLGVLVSYSFRKPLEKCVTPALGTEMCRDIGYAWEQVLGIHAAALF